MGDIENPPWGAESQGRADYDCLDGPSIHSALSCERQAKIELLPYQVDVCERINACTAEGHRRPLVVMRTAAGKTVVAVEMIKRAIARGEEVLVIVHTEELIQQTSRKLLAYDPGLSDHGFIKAGRPIRLLAPIQVASVQTVHARVFRSKKIELRKSGLIVIDEAHHAEAPTYQQIINRDPKAVVIGLTATPCRGDGRGLGNTFTNIVLGPTFEELQRAGRLVRSRIFAPVRPDLKGAHIRQGDYVESELAAAMDRQKLIGDIITHWHRLAEDRHTVVLATGVKHSVHIRDEFQKAGVRAEHIDSGTPKDERDEILTKLSRGEIQVVSNCMVLTEGWDQPEVSCLVLARPTKKLGMYIQMVGRVLRTAPGKTDALIIDHARAVHEHGLPEDEIEWTLHKDKKACNAEHDARVADPHHRGLVECPECGALRMQGEPCGACGWRPAAKPRYVEFQDGDLGEVDRERNVHVLPQDKLALYRELKAIYLFKRRRNPAIKDGWVAQKFRDKFGEFPPWGWRDAEPLDPSLQTRGRVRSREIAFAKSMGARR